MRDIRSDLQERVKLMEEQINAAQAYCEKLVKKLQSERDEKIGEL
jgi:CII-binding regulator of phage lambda lysogenization HflD